MRSGVLHREAGEGSRLLFSREEGEGNGALIKMKVCLLWRWGGGVTGEITQLGTESALHDHISQSRKS